MPINVNTGGNNKEVVVTQTIKFNNSSNKNITINNAVNGYLILDCFPTGQDSVFAYAKGISEVIRMELIASDTTTHPTNYKDGLTIYRFTCSSGAIINIFATNTQGSVTPNQNSGFIGFILG